MIGIYWAFSLTTPQSNLSQDHKTLAQKNHEELITCLEMIPTVKQFNDVTEWFHDDLGPLTTLYRLARDEICQGPISKALNEGFISVLHVEAFDPGNYIATKGEAGQGTTQFKRCIQRLVFENP